MSITMIVIRRDTADALHDYERTVFDDCVERIRMRATSYYIVSWESWFRVTQAEVDGSEPILLILRFDDGEAYMCVFTKEKENRVIILINIYIARGGSLAFFLCLWENIHTTFKDCISSKTNRVTTNTYTHLHTTSVQN